MKLPRSAAGRRRNGLTGFGIHESRIIESENSDRSFLCYHESTRTQPGTLASCVPATEAPAGLIGRSGGLPDLPGDGILQVFVVTIEFPRFV